MTDTELQEKMYRELLSIHRQLDRIEKMIIPTEHPTEEENRELDELEATSGDTIPWEEEKARLEERLR